MKDIIAIILAAGRGTRMNSDIPKVMHELLGKPMIGHVLDSLRKANITDIRAVIGYGSECLQGFFKDKNIKSIIQSKLLGSGDAVMRAHKGLKTYSGDVLIVYGDTPLLQHETIKRLIEKHRKSKASVTILAAELKDPTGYGRIIRGNNGRIIKIAEEEEAQTYKQEFKEINVGTCCFNARDLFEALGNVGPDNRKAEYYLTDTIGILSQQGKIIESVEAADKGEIIGVNTRKDLAQAAQFLKHRILEKIMADGVTVQDPMTTVIYPDVVIGKDTIIYPNTVIESDVEIGSACHIGPFARIRPGVSIGDRVEIGNFVELVRTRVAHDTKIKHHTYLGDAVVGKHVNIGAGTITANYDGKRKHKTVIEDGVFIGVGAILIAPVTIGRSALVGAGCVVPKHRNVPKNTTVVGVPARPLHTKTRRGAR